MLYEHVHLSKKPNYRPLGKRGILVIGWSGMRGIVTLATALALPEHFPGRDFILLSAFVVVLGTLLLQGLSLRSLLIKLHFPKDTVVEDEVKLARAATLKAALLSLQHDPSPAAEVLRREYKNALSFARSGNDLAEMPRNALRRDTLASSRLALNTLRNSGKIGDDAYWRVQSELDLFEASIQPHEEK